MELFAQPAGYSEFESPAGRLFCAVDDGGRVLMLAFLLEEGDREKALGRLSRLGYEPRTTVSGCRELQKQLREYFAGERRGFDLELKLLGTEFQQSVWQAMLAIPYGGTLSYGELASVVSRPPAVRAVGHASATNRIAIVVPCHRVLGANGSLTGYGGGLPLKQALLALEQGQAGLFNGFWTHGEKKKPSRSR